jgi:hypothetical protein
MKLRILSTEAHKQVANRRRSSASRGEQRRCSQLLGGRQLVGYQVTLTVPISVQGDQQGAFMVMSVSA